MGNVVSSTQCSVLIMVIPNRQLNASFDLAFSDFSKLGNLNREKLSDNPEPYITKSKTERRQLISVKDLLTEPRNQLLRA